MAGPKIKFCGITRPQDARIAAELGADFIGLNLHSTSRRRIEPGRAREIIQSIPASVIPVGLFVDAPVKQIQQTAQDLGLRSVQLHGKEAPEVVGLLKGLSVFKAISVKSDTLSTDLLAWRGVPNLVALLLDTGSGGTGIENDWETIRRFQSEGAFDGLPPLILAGGLNPENVGAVVKKLHPWAVDVSSGIEESPGIKSRVKMQAFAEAARPR